MLRRHGATLRTLLIFADVGITIAIIAVVSTAVSHVRGADPWSTQLPSPRLALLLYVSAWVSTLWLYGAHHLRPRLSLRSDVQVILQAAATMALATFAFLYFAQLWDVSRVFLVTLFACQVGFTLAARAAVRWAFQVARRKGLSIRWVVVLGTGEKARDFVGRLADHPELGLKVRGFLGPEEDAVVGPILGSLEDLPTTIRGLVIDEVAICLPETEWERIESIVKFCEQEGRIVRMPVPMPSVALATKHIEDLDGMPILSILVTPGTGLSLAVKRMIDLAGAVVGLVALSPLFLGLGAAIALTDGRPVLYRQTRVGLNGRQFEVVKFRTMVRDAEAQLAELREHNELDGHAFKMTEDPRITRIGRFLRRSSLDELPQLWNVLLGEMSLVGPRPPLPTEVAVYDPWHRRRLSMPPGITGLWQVTSRRETSFDRWVQLDLEYIDHWSPWLDIRIIIRTIPAVLRADGR